MTDSNFIDPEHIAISKSKGVDIDWRDGLRSHFSLEFLRDNCPCAHCTGAHGTEPQRTSYSKPDPNPFQMYKPRLKMNEVEAIGNYAIRVAWNDGHGSGIYSWSYLRRLAEETTSQCSPS